ncbi:MAG: hypothetical protein PHQ66_01860 [Candidatus Nanoarchaeia archaeon]|nr:hypothetical protein [Candidatus Nanoarchaeia archaeon]MDD5357880.1 hypothetical protein [Candidatus Nanoarchaeia archaeon]MDD5588799.1 hypothetical protein [Candidatus Nanoarchaeia archaeon]
MKTLNDIILFPQSLELLNACLDNSYGISQGNDIRYSCDKNKSFSQNEHEFKKILKKAGFDGVIRYSIEKKLNLPEYVFKGIPINKREYVVIKLPKVKVK